MGLLYDADSVENGPGKRTFTVRSKHAMKIAAAGLAAGEEAAVYAAVGAPNPSTTSKGNNCPTLDYIWAPLFRCGAPVVLTAENNQYIESVPGTYMVGAPSADPVFAGDVNITSDELGVEYISLPGECPAAEEPAPPPVDVAYDTCAGTGTLAVSASVQVALAPGSVVFTKKCPDEAEFDHHVMCDPATGEVLNVVVSYSPSGVPTSTVYNQDDTVSSVPVGSLVPCPDADTESDPVQMCDAGVQFTRWIVKNNGQPTGTKFDTDATGAPYVASGAEVVGVCVAPVLPVPTPDKTIFHNSWNIASGAFAGSHDPNGKGAVWSYANVQQTGRLKSVSVTVYEGDAMAINSIEIRHGQPSDKSWLLAGQSEDWDVSEDYGVDPLLDPNFEIECLGDSACFISWTEEA